MTEEEIVLAIAYIDCGTILDHVAPIDITNTNKRPCADCVLRIKTIIEQTEGITYSIIETHAKAVYYTPEPTPLELRHSLDVLINLVPLIRLE